MSFQYPYAFLVLLFIPVLIIIYLLKNKYKEATTPSTYLWELSKKFLKKKSPLHTFEHLISLLLQIVTISALAVCLAHPVITTPGKSDNILFILDGSASMSMEKDGKTCFEKAKEEIYQRAEDCKKGSSFSLIYASKETRVVCESVKDLDQFSLYLDSLKTGYQKNDLSDSLSKAQEVIDRNEVNLCYLMTDKKAENLNNINLVDCSVSAENYAISDLSYEQDGINIHVTALALSYQSDKNLTVSFYFNDRKVGSRKYTVRKGTPYSFQLDYSDAKKEFTDLKSVKAVIEDEDTLSLDNTMIVYNNEDTALAKVMLVSDDPFYLKNIFSAIHQNTEYKNKVDVISTSNYSATAGYDLYVFDSFTPSELPKEGSLFFFNSATTLEGTGFVAQKTIEEEEGIHLSYTDNSSSLLYQNLTKGIAHNDIVVKKYVRYSLSKEFTTVLSYENLPFVFAGKSDNQQRELVFAFDLHDSNLPLKYDFLALMRNAMAYANPRILDNYTYEIDEPMVLSLSNSMTSVCILTPEGKEERFKANRDYLTYTLENVGTYEARILYEDGSEKTIRLFVRFPEEESDPEKVDESTLSLVIDTQTKKGSSVFDSLIPIIIVACVFFLADWGIYAYEQY